MQNLNLNALKNKKPSEVIQKCPLCKCKDLLQFEGDVFCLSCNWDSIRMWVDAQWSNDSAKRESPAKKTALKPVDEHLAENEEIDLNNDFYTCGVA